MPDLRCTNCHLCHESKGFAYERGQRVEYHVAKVQGEGDGSSGVMLVGMNPGEHEVIWDRPFIGEAGQRLRGWLDKAYLDPGTCRITNVVRCRTPQNRVPEAEETEACFPYLLEEIATYKPKVIVLFGAYAIKEVAQVSVKVRDAIGTTMWSDRFGATLVMSAHPSYFVRMGPNVNPEEERCINALKLAKEIVHGVKQDATPAKVNYQVADTPEKAFRLLDKLMQVPVFSYDTETSSLDWRTCKVLCMSFSWKEKTAAVLPFHLSNPKFDEDGILPKMWDADTEARLVEGLKKVFARRDMKVKIAQNSKFDNHVLFHSMNIRVAGKVYDTLLGDYLIDEERDHDLKSMALLHTDMGDYDKDLHEHLPNKKVSFATVPHEVLWKYSAADVDATIRLAAIQYPQLQQQDLLDLLWEIVMPYSRLLEKMEERGIYVDLEKQKELDEKYAKKIADLEIQLAEHPDVRDCEERLRQAAGDKLGLKWDGLKNKKLTREEYIEVNLEKKKEFKFNVKSFRHVQMLIYDVCGLKTPRGYKPGDTSAEVLDELKDKSSAIGIISSLRTLNKFYGTYIHNVPEFVREDGRVHTSYAQHRTDTGRLASSKPNFQNQPKRGEEAKDVREMYISPPGYVLLEADYKQAEFRYWGAYSEDFCLKADIEANLDIHSEMAIKYLGAKPGAVSEWDRFIAKMTVFGIMYGRGPQSISEEYKIKLDRAQGIIDDFLGRYPQAAAWLEKAKAFACDHGYVRNWFGRRRHLPILKGYDLDGPMRDGLIAAALRQAQNAPIQGAAHDHLSYAALRIDPRIQEERIDCHIILDIHDALVFEVKEEDLEKAARLIKYEMERPVVFRGKEFPLRMDVDLSVGTRWSKMEKYKVGELCAAQ